MTWWAAGSLPDAPRAGVLSVGSELVRGDVADTNAAWLAARLSALGFDVRLHAASGDDLDDLVAALRFLLELNELVVVGGGLGPTHDDITREAVARAAGLPLEARPELAQAIEAVFAAAGRDMPASNRRQARVPAGARALPPVGTAPGFALEVEASTALLYALPGVPWELREMFEQHVLPDLLARTGRRAALRRVVHVSGMDESRVAEVLEDLVGRLGGRPAVDLRADGGRIAVGVSAAAADPAAAAALVDPVVEEILALLGPAVAGLDDEDLEEAVVRLLRRAGATVATAESATAGRVAARLGRVAGASAVLRGGVVVYATETKHSVLGVPADVLAGEGPVSDAVTRELAVRVRDRFGATYGVGVTGVAGPDSQGGQPVGTGLWALADSEGVEVHRARFPGDRDTVQERLATAALELLRRRLLAPAPEGGGQ